MKSVKIPPARTNHETRNFLPAGRVSPLNETVVPDDTDAELVARCRGHDTVAMRELVERFQTDVFAVCYRLLHHTHDAEDVAQEVFVRAFRSLHRWDATRPLRPWLLAIAVNRCRTAAGKRTRRPETADYLDESAGKPPVDEANELTAAIRSAVDELRPEYREVFVLFHEQGRSYDEISTAVDRPVGTIKTWLHRARTEVLTELRRSGLVPTDQPERI